MDGSAFRNMDLGGAFKVGLVLAFIGACAVVAGLGWVTYFVAQHIHWL